MPPITTALLLGALAAPASAHHGTAGAVATLTMAADALQTARPGDGSSPADAGQSPDPDEKAAAPGASPAPDQQAGEEDEEHAGAQPSGTIVVTARRLDTARTEIDTALGATVYALTNDTIENRPGGETGSVADVLMQAPGVTRSGSALVIRGSRANQVRINNVIVPEALADPADQLSSRLAETTRLITGTLPAQFGFAPAGVISVTTKNGLYQHGGQAELFLGSDGMVEPALEWTGSVEGTSLFASADLEHSRARLADRSGVIADERRTAVGGLGFADHVIDSDNRISMIFGGLQERLSIGATGIGPGSERNSNAYGVGTFQHSAGGFTLQASLFAGVASDRFMFAAPTSEYRSSFGTQIDARLATGASHILRFGLLATRSRSRELDLGGVRSSAGRTSAAVYVQDEWTIAPSLTLNPGLRVEWLGGASSAAVVEPRASLVWSSGAGLTAHLGYARYASAPPLGGEGIGASLPDERDDYVDLGLQQKLGPLTLGVDAYSRRVRNYLAGHETVGSAVVTPFAFSRAYVRGLELSATYARRSFSAWANLSLADARATTIIGGEGLFAPATLKAGSMRYVPLASDRPVTLSGGLLQRFGRLSLSGDLLLSSGAVATTSALDPNGSRHSAYALLGAAAVYHFRMAGAPADLRIDLTNLTDVRYATSDAANLEGGWTRFGRGRAITVGIEQSF